MRSPLRQFTTTMCERPSSHLKKNPYRPARWQTGSRNVQLISLPWYAAVENNSIVGYAYASAWKSRSGYRYSAEVTAYVADGYGRRGIGSQLYRRLVPAVSACGLHTLLAGIALPNVASVALHEQIWLCQSGSPAAGGVQIGALGRCWILAADALSRIIVSRTDVNSKSNAHVRDSSIQPSVRRDVPRVCRTGPRRCRHFFLPCHGRTGSWDAPAQACL